MSLDAALRNELRKTVQEIREILTEDLQTTLERRYGLHRSGEIEPVENLPEVRDDDEQQITRNLLEDLLDGSGHAVAYRERYDHLLRALAFTHLNRFVAFKLMEQPGRGLIHETVSRGQKSRGFLRFAGSDSEVSQLYDAGYTDEAYRRYILHLCGTLDREIGVLFDPDDLASRVFPSGRAIRAMLDLLNQESLTRVWEDEETIGWVYQFYTPKEQRDRARKASSAPRNSYEMAFLNQFYTPDYVVRFLVDNTLGRLWLEMLGGGSALADHCTMMVLGPKESLQPRGKKDPRQIRVLDPACGSGHFLAYAFDVLRTIYTEAWEDPDLGPVLRQEYPERETFDRAIPALILEHNLHGIDIDRRATQLASLVLYLKARGAHPEARIERVNVVCAEPMPGNRESFEAFLAKRLGTEDGVLPRILREIWGALELAGEVGSVLELDEQISGAVRRELEAWRQAVARGGETALLFPEMQGPEGRPPSFADVRDARFWAGLEQRITGLLEEFAAEAEGAEGLRRRLFARNSAQGLHFIEVMRAHYDVVLMNPPFGAASVGAQPYIKSHYPRSRQDIYAVFVERFLERLEPGGRLGAITSRTGFFLSSFQAWREQVLLGEARPLLVADLGHGVMDAAMVEAAAYVLERAS